MPFPGYRFPKSRAVFSPSDSPYGRPYSDIKGYVHPPHTPLYVVGPAGPFCCHFCLVPPWWVCYLTNMRHCIPKAVFRLGPLSGSLHGPSCASVRAMLTACPLSPLPAPRHVPLLPPRPVARSPAATAATSARLGVRWYCAARSTGPLPASSASLAHRSHLPSGRASWYPFELSNIRRSTFAPAPVGPRSGLARPPRRSTPASGLVRHTAHSRVPFLYHGAVIPIRPPVGLSPLPSTLPQTFPTSFAPYRLPLLTHGRRPSTPIVPHPSTPATWRPPSGSRPFALA